MKKIALILLIVLAAMLSLTACEGKDGSRESYAYSIVGETLAEMRLVSDVSGKVVFVGMEEYFMPSVFVRSDNYEEGLFDDSAILEVETDGQMQRFVKVIDIDGENFTIAVKEMDVDGEKVNYIDFKSRSKQSLNTYLASEKGSKAYIRGLKKGLVTVGEIANDKYQELAYASYKGSISVSCMEYSEQAADGLPSSEEWAIESTKFKAFLIELFNGEAFRIDENSIPIYKEQSKSNLRCFESYMYMADRAYSYLSQEIRLKSIE
ncbi:MAG: hypothetical protein PHX51_03365 [Clostridia bacterium]|nr:hypothetical protein [Clostridia bacterium]